MEIIKSGRSGIVCVILKCVNALAAFRDSGLCGMTGCVISFCLSSFLLYPLGALADQEKEPALFVVKSDGKEGFIDSKGEIAIKPVYQRAYPFRDGLAAVQVDGLWGYVDSRGDMVIQPQFIMAGFFSDGLASVRKDKYSARWGYIDKDGEMVIKPRFDCAGPFRNGIARVGHMRIHNKLLGLVADIGVPCEYVFIDKDGNYVKEPHPTHFASGDPDELILYTSKESVGFMKPNGEVAIEPQFEAGAPFSDGLACVRKGGLYGYINSEGEWIISPRFEYPNNFSEGLAGVPVNDKGWGFIDQNGKVVIPPKFGWIYGEFRHGLAEVAFDGKIGYINTKGEWVWEPSD